ncbi:hypothetical protein BHE74_00031369 [Ensete ventricosum]|nr:hypothetical protein BHE74_00031369 [Ensete ventricosum]
MLPIFPRSIRSLSALSIKLMRFIPTSLVISSLLDPLRTSSVQDYKVSSLYLYRKLLIFLYDRFRINDLPHFHRVSSPKKHRELFLRDWQHPSSGCCQRWERFHVTVIHEGEGVRVGVCCCLKLCYIFISVVSFCLFDRLQSSLSASVVLDRFPVLKPPLEQDRLLKEQLFLIILLLFIKT